MAAICYILQNFSDIKAAAIIRDGIVEAGWAPREVSLARPEVSWNLAKTAFLIIDEAKSIAWVGWQHRSYTLKPNKLPDVTWEITDETWPRPVIDFDPLSVGLAWDFKVKLKIRLKEIKIQMGTRDIIIQTVIAVTLALTFTISIVVCLNGVGATLGLSPRCIAPQEYNCSAR